MTDASTKAARGARRLTRSDRREQLLDVAAALLAERGASAITMERLAEHAEVSKALPYSHFDNAEAVLVSLRQREVAHMGEQVVAAMATAQSPDERVRAAIGAYFDVVAERGAILAVLMSPGSPAPAEEPEVSEQFVTTILRQNFDLPAKDAAVIADVLQGSLSGAVSAWARGRASRRRVQALVTEFALAGIRAARES